MEWQENLIENPRPQKTEPACRAGGDGGALDLVADYYHATRAGLPAMAGRLGAAYVTPVLYVPLLMITHITAFNLMLRREPKAAVSLASVAAAS